MWKNIEKISNKNLSLLIASTILIGILIFFLPIVLIGINQVTHRGETRYTELEVMRAENLIQNETDLLDQYLLDWSGWDDTYQFAQDGNQEYIDNNLADTTIVNLDIDIFLVLNASNEFVFGKYVDRTSQVEAPIPLDVQTLLNAYPDLVRHSDLQAGQKGIASIPGYQMLVASRPILTSMNEGPLAGTLIWIRLLDAKKLDEFSRLAFRKLVLFPASSPPQGTPALPAASKLQDQVFVHPRNSQTVVGYKYVPDLKGRPLFILQVENPRDLYAQGRTTAIIFTGAFLFLGFLLFGGAYHFTINLLNSRIGRKYLQRFQTIVHQSSEAILLVGSDCHILEANPASQELLHWEPDLEQKPCLKSLLKFVPELDESLVLEICHRGSTSAHHCTRHDGLAMEIELSASLINDPEIRAFSLILRDVTARKIAEKALQASEERYMLAANGANDGLWDWDLLNGAIYFSPRWKAMLGYAEDEVSPAPEAWFDRIHTEDRLLLQSQLSNHLRNRTGNFECEHRVMHKDGQYRWMLARGVAVWNPAGYAQRIAGSQTDITNRKKLEEQLRYDALHDGLTGMGNRTLLIDHLNHVNERKKRKPELLFALFFLDFDRFKQINDTLGHAAGDQLLIEAAQRLEVGLRTTDTVTRFSGPETLARIAGDEFVILLEDFHTIEDVQKVAERVNRLLSSPYNIAGQEVTITASVGLVVPEATYENVEDIIRDADIAMYRAKLLGGAQVVQFNQEMYQGTIARMQLESDLRKAVERQEFEVYYQPVFTLDNDHIAGFEALVRWNHPQRGFLLPAEFIQVSEEIGMIVPIGYFVLEEACRKMQSWRKELKISPELTISVNFSPRQILNADLLENIRTILKNTGFDPKKLWLEVTEDTLLENSETVITRLNDLRALGIRIEIDDFGTGYSSLSYLQNLPIDGFKIDRSFIKDIQGGGQQIVKTLVDLGHSLGLTEVAEGVETEPQREYLKTLSCQYAQGFLMSRPISAAAIEELLGAAIQNRVADGIV